MDPGLKEPDLFTCVIFKVFFLLVLDGDLAVDEVVTWISDGFLVVVGGVSCWCGGFVAVVAVGGVSWL